MNSSSSSIPASTGLLVWSSSKGLGIGSAAKDLQARFDLGRDRGAELVRLERRDRDVSGDGELGRLVVVGGGWFTRIIYVRMGMLGLGMSGI